jgi:hypothetical protein
MKPSFLLNMALFLAVTASADPSPALIVVGAGDVVTASNRPVDVVLFAKHAKHDGRFVSLDLVRVSVGSMLQFNTLTRLETGMDDVVTVETTLNSGTALFSTRRRSAASECMVKTPKGRVSLALGSEVSVTADGVVTVLSGEATVVIQSGNVATAVPVSAGWRYVAAADALAKLSDAELATLKAEFAELRRVGWESGYVPLLPAIKPHIEPYVSPTQGAK